MKRRKTALVLSGGGSRGAYQCGVWQALTELGIKIDIVVGVSVGAINGAMVVQGDPIKTAELWRKMETDMLFDVEPNADLQSIAKEVITKGGAGTSGLQSMLPKYVDEETIRNSDVEFGLLTVEFPLLKPHYLWKEDIPQGKLHDYITASASLFPALKAHTIDGKMYIDGGYENVMPVLMPEEKGATHTIAVYLDAVGKFKPRELDEVENLTLIKSKWDLGSVLFFETDHTNRIMRLGYLDAMKTFGVYDGEYFSFIKGTFDKKTLYQADSAAKVFELDPLVLYGKISFLEAMEEKTHELKSIGKNADTPIGTLKEALKISNKKLLTLAIAQNLKAHKDKSIFASPYASKILKDEAYAARFLIKFGLL